MKRFLFIVLMLILATSLANAGDLFNLGTVYYGNAQTVPTTGDVIAYWEDYAHITYMFRYTYIDSSDAAHSKPFYIGDANITDGYIYAIQSATGDANCILHFSADNRNKWETTTPAGLDAISSTAKTDTVGYQAGADDIKFHYARWCVVELVGGGTSNQDGNIITFIMKLKKATADAIKPTGEFSRLGKVSRNSTTNP